MMRRASPRSHRERNRLRGALPGLVGDDLADGFARHLGRDVRLESLDTDDCGRLLEPVIGERGTCFVDS